MNKSFKKVIACLLAVLMAVFSFPFSAFAMGGDYTADVRLVFTPVYVGGYFDYAETTANGSSYFDASGLAEAPLTYNYTMPNDYTVSGNLVLEKAMTDKKDLFNAGCATEAEALKNDPDFAYSLDEDRTLGVGDYFAVSIVIEGVPSLESSQQYIQYSENLTPAGHYKRTTGSGKNAKTFYGLCTIEDSNASKIESAGDGAWEAYSGTGLYDGVDDGGFGNQSSIDTDLHVIKSLNMNQTGEIDPVPVTSIDPSMGLTNPYTGETPDSGEVDEEDNPICGYTYDNKFVANTFVFKITGEGSLDFSVYDIDNTKEKSYSGMYFNDDGHDTKVTNTNTYATQAGCPGSNKMYFYGKNVNTGEDINEQGGTEDPCAGGHDFSVEVTPAVPGTCVAKGKTAVMQCSRCEETTGGEDTDYDLTNHDWRIDAEVPATCMNSGTYAGKTCQREGCGATEGYGTIAPLGHDYDEGVITTPATCTEDGVKTYTCTRNCGETDYIITEKVNKLGHDMQLVSAKINPTCKNAGKEAVYACSHEGCTETTGGEVIDALGHDYDEGVITTPATCTEDGVKTYTCTRNCGETDYIITEKVNKLGHDWRIDAEVPATCKKSGTYAGKTCQREGCGATEGYGTIDALGHDYAVTADVASTEDTQGYTEFTCSRNCGEEGWTYRDYKPLADHVHTWREDAEVPATCTRPGVHAGRTCTKESCGATEGYGTIAPLGHDYDEGVITTPATCTEDGVKTYTCTRNCGETDAVKTEPIAHLGHDWRIDAEVPATCQAPGTKAGKTCQREGCGVTEGYGEIAQLEHTPVSAGNAVAPTFEAEGKEADTICDVCKTLLTEGAPIAKLDGVVVTVGSDYENMGDVTGLAYGSTTVLKGSKVTLTAQAVEGAEFDGWMVENKIVSTDATYSFVAYQNTTVTPVFVNPADTSATISVVFIDCYNNVTAAYTDVTVEEFQAAMAAKIPEGSNYPSKTFQGWSMTDAEIAVLDKSATITASYATVETGYTVATVAPAQFEDGSTTMTNVAFDTKVVVSATGAKAWKIGEATVAYGDTYEFYVGSDVTVTPVFDAVTATPSVAIVSATRVPTSPHKIAFIATMTAADGYTIIDHGFVYGKAATAAELTLENVGKTIAASGAAVKAASATTSACDQFALNYGITNQTSKATAVAFITYKNAAGEISTAYSGLATFDYSTNAATID